MKKIIVFLISCCLYQSAMAEGSRFLNLKLATMTGPTIEYGFDKFGIGVGSTSWTTSSTDANGPYTFSGSITALRGSYYFDGFGVNGWHGTVLLGSVSVKASQTISGTLYNSSANGTYSGGVAGYEWFWGGFNLGAGLGFLSLTLPSVKITDSSGTTVSTLSSSAYSSGTVELSIGYAF